MVRRDTKHILRNIFGRESSLRHSVTLGCNGMLITGLVSNFENYIATLGHLGSQSGEPSQVMNSIEVFSSLRANEELQAGPDVFLPTGTTPADCDDLVVLQEVVIQLPNGMVSPTLSFWFGRLSAIDFYIDTPPNAPTIPFGPPQEQERW